MAVDQTVPSDQDIKRWFLDAPDVAAGTFEFALTITERGLTSILSYDLIGQN
jgi:hypothetical protein